MVIWLQTPTVFWLGGGTISQLLNIHGVNDVRQTEIHAAETKVPEPSVFEVELATEKTKSNKSPGIDQIPAEMFKAGGKTIHYVFFALYVFVVPYMYLLYLMCICCTMCVLLFSL